MTEEALEQAGVRDITTINLISPDIQIYNNSGGNVISIRGVRANSNAPSSESPVVLNLDGAYIGRMNGTDALFFDVNRIEVLEGPQGTLYGRNASAGAINVITNKPQFQFGGIAEIEYGNYDLARVFAAVDLPLSDTFAVRVAGQTFSHNGYMVSGLNDAKEDSFRLSALYQPTSNQRLLVTADSEHIGGEGGGASNVIAGAPGVYVPANPLDDTKYWEVPRYTPSRTSTSPGRWRNMTMTSTRAP